MWRLLYYTNSAAIVSYIDAILGITWSVRETFRMIPRYEDQCYHFYNVNLLGFIYVYPILYYFKAFSDCCMISVLTFEGDKGMPTDNFIPLYSNEGGCLASLYAPLRI